MPDQFGALFRQFVERSMESTPKAEQRFRDMLSWHFLTRNILGAWSGHTAAVAE
jgi:hypothetical protein